MRLLNRSPRFTTSNTVHDPKVYSEHLGYNRPTNSLHSQSTNLPDLIGRQLGTSVALAARYPVRLGPRPMLLTTSSLLIRAISALGRPVGIVDPTRTSEQVAISRQQDAIDFIEARIVIPDAGRIVAGMKNGDVVREYLASRKTPRKSVSPDVAPINVDLAVAVWHPGSRPDPTLTGFVDLRPEAIVEGLLRASRPQRFRVALLAAKPAEAFGDVRGACQEVRPATLADARNGSRRRALARSLLRLNQSWVIRFWTTGPGIVDAGWRTEFRTAVAGGRRRLQESTAAVLASVLDLARPIGGETREATELIVTGLSLVFMNEERRSALFTGSLACPARATIWTHRGHTSVVPRLGSVRADAGASWCLNYTSYQIARAA